MSRLAIIGRRVILITVVAAISQVVAARELEICPPWVVEVLDDHGNALTNCVVSQAWQFYGLAAEQQEERTVDATGSASFPVRSIKVGAGRYAAARAGSLLNVHASFKPSARVEVSAGGFKRTLVYYSDHQLLLTNTGATGTANRGQIKIKVRLVPLDLIDVVHRRDRAAVQRFIADKPTSVTMRDAIGFTPLHWAMQRDNLEIARALIEAGAQVNAGATDGKTPLHQAAHNGALELMSLLIAKGANVNAVIHDSSLTEDLYTPLHIAVRNTRDDKTQIQMIDLLTEHGADVNAQARFNQTALFIAAYLGGSNVVKELLAKGAAPNIRNTDGKTPLDIAKEFKKSANIKVLQEFVLKPK